MLDELRKSYEEATGVMERAKSARLKVAVAMYKEVLAEKGITDGQAVKLILSDGKEMAGEFKILHKESTADIRFYPYKKDGTLSTNPRVISFGWLPNLTWNENYVKQVEVLNPSE